ncbi:MAG: putative sigma regulatory protein MucB/RseB [Bryobacterales bacterium]|nr:putative sigma regulatory protein MucB/RseB [Bryobacterales bacterium]
MSSHPDLQSASEVVLRMNRALREQERELCRYSVHRRYILRNRHLEPEATSSVMMNYDAASGKHFTITGSQHSGGISQRVFKNAMEAEESASTERPSPSEINSQHYSLSFDGIETRNGRRCYRIGLKPRERTKYLLDGVAWIDAADFALVRVEGAFARPLSFWIGRPLFQQDYGRYGRFWLPSHSRSLAYVKLFGESELEIEYFDYQLPTPVPSKSHYGSVLPPVTP